MARSLLIIACREVMPILIFNCKWLFWQEKMPAEHVLLQPSDARRLEAQTLTSRSRVMLVMCLSIIQKKKLKFIQLCQDWLIILQVIDFHCTQKDTPFAKTAISDIILFTILRRPFQTASSLPHSRAIFGYCTVRVHSSLSGALDLVFSSN